jgi:hypothetical protein
VQFSIHLSCNRGVFIYSIEDQFMKCMFRHMDFAVTFKWINAMPKSLCGVQIFNRIGSGKAFSLINLCF